MTAPGKTVHHFRILENLGEGGMGDVFVAEDQRLNRRVALKALREEHRLRPEAKARLLREARILSQLDHPHICRLFDYLEADDADYLVLELIDGRSLKDVLATGLDRLDAHAKLRIGEQIAHVLVAAHGQGVVHRDLKPGNVMLTPSRDVKVLDFGIARSVREELLHSGADLDEEALAKQIADAVTYGGPSSTIEIGRPEDDITAHDDRRPSAATGLGPDDTLVVTPPASEDSQNDDTQRMGREGETLRSTPTVDWADTGKPEPAFDHAAPDNKTVTYLRTQLGTIVGTVAYMSPEQAQGKTATAASDMYSLGLMLQELFTGVPPYGEDLSPAMTLIKAARAETLPLTGVDPDLAQLVERLQSLDPATRPTAVDAAERLRWIREKPLRRRRQWLAVAAIVMLALIAMVMTWQAIQIGAEAERAERAAERAEREAERANREADAANAVSTFLIDLFEVPDPFNTSETTNGSDVTAREILDRGAARVREQLASEPHLQARMTATIGEVYIKVGLWDEAGTLLEETLTLLDGGPVDDPLLLSGVLFNLGRLRQQQLQLEEAEEAFRRSIELRRDRLPPDDPVIAESHYGLGAFHWFASEYEESAANHQAAIDIYSKHEGFDREITRSRMVLGYIELQLGHYARAAELLERVAATQRDLLGADHPELGFPYYGLGEAYRHLAQFERAEKVLDAALEIRKRSLGEQHPHYIWTINEMAALRAEQGRFTDARRGYEQALEFSAEPFTAMIAYGGLAELAIAEGRYEVATRHLDAAFALQGDTVRERPIEAHLLSIRGDLLRAVGKPQAAAEAYRRGLATGDLNTNFDRATLLHGLAEIERADARRETAEEHYDECVRLASPDLGDDHPLMSRCRLGIAWARSNRAPAEARTLVTRAIDALEASYANGHPVLAQALVLASETSQALGDAERARQALEKAVDVYGRTLGADHPITRDTRRMLESL
ncbi:MAG: tetratricopeptide repeat protein [Acidobacteriota bacterium]